MRKQAEMGTPSKVIAHTKYHVDPVHSFTQHVDRQTKCQTEHRF